MSFLKIENISKDFGKNHILKDINLNLDKGSFLVLVGPSGCGKSTLLNIIAGLEEGSKGEVYLDGKPLSGLNPAKRNIAMVFQSYALYPNMTVQGNISFGLEMRRLKKVEINQKIHEVSKILKIEHLLDRKPAQLSGGQRQRVAMGRAIVRDPALFLFDEPLSNLDAKLRVDMRVEIKKLHKRLNVTVVYVTHDQVEAMTLADQIAVMNLGEIQQIGSPHEIYYNPINVFTSSFMGSPTMNYLNAMVAKGAKENDFMLRLRDNDGELLVPISRPPKSLSKFVGKPITLGLRPEAITVGQGEHAFKKKVEVVEMTGAESYVFLQIDGREIQAKVETTQNLQVNQSYNFVIDPSKAVLFCPDTERNLNYIE